MSPPRPLTSLNPFSLEWRLHPRLHASRHQDSDLNWTLYKRFPTLEDAQAELERQQKPRDNEPIFVWRLKQ